MRPAGNMDIGFSRSAVQTLSRSHCKNIKQKISQWEGRTNGISNPAKWHPKDFGVRYNCHQEIHPKKNPSSEGKSKTEEHEKQEYTDTCPSRDESASSWVCSRVRQIESQKDPEASLPPGNFYTSQILWKKIEALPPVLNLSLEHCVSIEKELNLRALDSSCGVTKSLENIYCEPEGQEGGPSINPLPKPRRTFRYLSESGGIPCKERPCDKKYCENCPCTESSLASPQPSGPKNYGGKIRGRSKRKSFEFEDIQHFRNRNAQKVHEELGRSSGSGLYYTQSEDNIYEDIIYPTRENPYEDIPMQPLPIWKSPSAWKLPPPKSPFRAPKLVLKIEDVFESKRGKKRIKLYPYTGKEAPPSKGETSGNESDDDHGYKQSKDTEERLKVIPKFCFPDSKDWVPTSELKSETFSFVLTGEDGSRWFGYCKKLLPEGKGRRLPEVYCMVSRLGCFNLFSKILDEVEKRREMSPALVYPFMQSVMEAPFPAPGRTITVKSYLPGAGDGSVELCRPLDSRLEHVDFECLFKCLSVCHLIQVCASLLLERRVIFVANSLRIKTPFLTYDKGDEILPPKLQAALLQILEERNEILAQERNFSQDVTLSSLVSEAFVRFFVELVGHYSLNMTVTERGERVFQREPFRKSHTSRSVRHFLDLFMETQMFAGFIQDRELRKSGVKGLFEVRALQYLETIPESEPSGVNRILRSLGELHVFLLDKCD
uniref:DENN domain containing 2C n=1 Tax=Jaculus jaculus TaxID=51337 RepID=A0A8C5K7S3_JACJA